MLKRTFSTYAIASLQVIEAYLYGSVREPTDDELELFDSLIRQADHRYLRDAAVIRRWNRLMLRYSDLWTSGYFQRPSEQRIGVLPVPPAVPAE